MSKIGNVIDLVDESIEETMEFIIDLLLPKRVQDWLIARQRRAIQKRNNR